jgi:hypothetical protein
MRRPSVLIASGALAVAMAGCAPIPETVTWEQWAAGAVDDASRMDLYSGRAVGGTLADGVQSYTVSDTFWDVAPGVSTLDLHCRSTGPVVFEVARAEPVTVDCEKGGTVETELQASSRVLTSADGRAYWLAIIRPEPDAFVDGEPVEP